jgi:uncharacterized protein YgfB (UPF0149 family)
MGIDEKLLREMEADAKKVFEHLDHIIQTYDAIEDKGSISDNLLNVIKYAKTFANSVYFKTDAMLAAICRYTKL